MKLKSISLLALLLLPTLLFTKTVNWEKLKNDRLLDPHSLQLKADYLGEVCKEGYTSEDRETLILELLSLPGIAEQSTLESSLKTEFGSTFQCLYSRGESRNNVRLLSWYLKNSKVLEKKLDDETSKSLRSRFTSLEKSRISKILLYAWELFHVERFGHSYKLARSLANSNTKASALIGAIYLYGPKTIRDLSVVTSYLQQSADALDFQGIYFLLKYLNEGATKNRDWAKIYRYANMYGRLRNQNLWSPYAGKQYQDRVFSWGKTASLVVSEDEKLYILNALSALFKKEGVESVSATVEVSTTPTQKSPEEKKQDAVIKARINRLIQQVEFLKSVGQNEEARKIEAQIIKLKEK